jgi:hypothetical protein
MSVMTEPTSKSDITDYKVIVHTCILGNEVIHCQINQITNLNTMSDHYEVTVCLNPIVSFDTM